MDLVPRRGCVSINMLRVVGIAAVLVGCVPSQLPSHHQIVWTASPHDYGAEATWFTLPNGLKVALVPDPHANLVRVDVRYLVGSADDPPGKPGLAHLVEHMLFQQRTEPDGPTLASRFRQVSLNRNAYTTTDATHFYSVALAPQLDQLLELEASRLASGCHGIDQPAFDREAAIVAEEIRLKQTPLLDEIDAALFGHDHVYAHSPGGSTAGLTLADVCQFVDAHYAANRAVLIVGGRFDAVALRAAIATHFGPLPRRTTSPAPEVSPAALTAGLTTIHGLVAKPSAMIILPAAPWGSIEAYDDALFDDLVIRKLQIRAEREPWILHVGHGMLGGARAGLRYIYVTVSDREKLSQASSAVFAAANDVRWEAPEGLATAVMRRRIWLRDQFESFTGRATLCADALQFAGDQGCRLDELRAMDSVKASDVTIRAVRVTEDPRHVVQVLPDESGMQRQGEPIHELDAAIAEPPESDPAMSRSSVDLDEADHPIGLPSELARTTSSSFTLANGLRVVMASDFSQPLVDARLVLPVGMTGSDSKRDVVAYLAANLLEPDMGRRYTADDFLTLRWLFGLDAASYRWVTDHTTFAIRGAADRADWHLWRLSWLVQRGAYTERSLSLFREAEARRERRAHDPDAATDAALAVRELGQAVREAMFGRGHPYATPRDADLEAALATTNLQQVRLFRNLYYGPAGATLIITGHFDPVAIRQTVTELFGDWTTASSIAAPPRPVTPAMQPAPGPTWIAYDTPSASQVRITLAFVSKSQRTASAAARAVLSEMVRQRIELVRTELSASYGLDASYRSSQAGDVLQIDGPVNAARAGEVLRRILSDLEKLHTRDDELRADFVRARRVALAEALADPSVPGATARRIEYAVTAGADLGQSQIAAAIAATTLRDVSDLIERDLQPVRMVGVVSGRPTDVTPALSAARISNARTFGNQPHREPALLAPNTAAARQQ